MSNQPPTRPWFRLASIARPAPAPAPAPAPPPVARPAPSLPTFRNTPPSQEPTPPPANANAATTRTGSVPSSPVVPRPGATAPSASLPSSPVAPRNSPPAKPRVINAPSSPAVKTNTPQPSKLASTSSVPSTPVQKTVSYATSSVPNSPIKASPATRVASTTTYSPPKPVATYSPPKAAAAYSPPKVVATTTTRGVSPKTSPLKSYDSQTRTPPRSPVTKPTAPPPSPLLLPPSHAETKFPPEAEQKTVLVQKSVERHHHPNVHNPNDHHHNKHDNGKQASSEAKDKGPGRGPKKHYSGADQEMGARVITIAGENRGAFMELIQTPNRHVFGGSPHTLVNKHGSGSDSDSGNDQGNRGKGARRNGMGSPPMRAFTNSNVQGINNSIVFNASCKDNNPGVHLTLSRKPSGHGNGNGIYVKEHVNGHHMS